MFWKEVAGATSYTVAVRPKNGTEQLEWVEYSATSFPHSISGKLVMSDLEYEVRLSAVNANTRSEWSRTVSVSTPAIQPAPIHWNIVQYYVGDVMEASIGQRPFENRSTWHWFMCDADESDCKLLPVPSRSPTYQYRVPEIARGKLIKAQVDYDKDWVSYSAADVIGMVSTTDRLWANVTNGRINVFWDEAERPNATSYRIRVRPKDSTQPLQWTEHLATSSPYVILGYQVMSGLEYELQVFPFNADRQSEWSQKAITVTIPDRQAAPAEAIDVITDAPYRVGNVVQVSLASQHPFTSRSVWHWFLCDTDGSNCKLLPLKQTDTHKLLIPEIARGKLVKVQSDYRKDGVSYTARAIIGIVNALVADDASRVNEPMPNPAVTDTYKMECPEKTAPREDLLSISIGLESHLYAMRLKLVTVQWDATTRGGAVEPMCNDLVVVTPRGTIAVVRPDGNLKYLDARVPMNLDENSEHPNASQVQMDQFRVADIMLKQHSSKHWELFVTHHYFTGECIRFRLSSTTIIRDGNNITVSPAWRTIFDADPCLRPGYGGGIRAGGRMLTDGADHLLVITGDHGTGSFSQDPESHLGKLLRVEIETGDVEILASGLRNSQGLTRDAYGNLWGTDHGPQGGDELNLLKPGENYGWPVVTYGLGYGRVLNSPELDRAGRHDGFTLPVFSWIPSIAISSIIVNNAERFPLWGDDLLIATLSGTKGFSLYRLRRVGTEVQNFERIEIGWRIRDMTQMPDGRVVLLRDNGIVYFMGRDYSYCHNESVSDEHIYKVDCETYNDTEDEEAIDAKPPTESNG